MANRINIGVGFSVDKAGLTEMQSLFQQIANRAKEPGVNLTTGLQKAASTANTLDQILEKTFNAELGTLNITKFNQELTKSGLTLKQIKTDFSAVGNQGATAYNRLAQAILGTNYQLKESSKLLDSMADTFTKTVKWGIASSVFNNMTSAIRKAYTYSKQLDTSLNDIRIVTDKSAENMDKFAEKANSAAKTLGASTLDYSNAALIYYQQGLSDEEAQARAETTVKAANVTGQAGATVSEQLTAVWNGYKATAEETELYVDKLAAVAATTAADLEELSVGMSKVASAANAMGVDFDDLNAQIATIVSVTRQAPESVGTALKTIYARLGDLKVDGVDEFGVKLGEVTSQMETMGIKILDTNGDMRDMTSVMTEVAEKWNTWTRAQQQAAAIAMAGKRQYNNLVALFENWDMYSDALETSANAMGTLQHQQDIYMESTEAKLKTLKATYQDLYKGIINEDELNAGIEALTNLVQVFDNFFDSFGSGIKSVSAFGAIIANIFNKQIINSINNAVQRQEVFKQNLAITEKHAEVRTADLASVGDNATASQIAAEKNTEIQLKYANQIYEARAGLNQEQAQTLIQKQQEIGQLEEQIVLEQKRIDAIKEKKILDEEDYRVLEENGYLLEEIEGHYQLIQEETKRIREETIQLLSTWKDFSESGQLYVETTEEIEQVLNQIDNCVKVLDKDYQKSWHTLEKKLTTVEAFEEHEEEILVILDEIVGASKQELQINAAKTKDAKKLAQIYAEQYENKAKQNIAKQDADSMIDMAKNSKDVAQSVTLVTSSLSSMAMAWSSVHSVMQVINDDSASLGEKTTQIVMTLGMSIPMIISSFSKLKEAFSVESTLMDVINAKTAKRIALQNLQAKETAKEIAFTQLEQSMKARSLAITELEIDQTKEEILGLADLMTEKELNLVATNQQNAGLVRSNIVRRANVSLTEEEAAALQAEIVMRGADTVAMEAEKTASDALNASLLANPIAITVAAMAALVAITAAVVTIKQKQLQAEIDLNNAEIEKINKIQEEEKENEKLFNEYEDLYKQYKENKIEKEALYDITDQLCEKYKLEGSYLAKLTGNYDSLSKSIKEARKQELQSALTQSEREKNFAASNVLNVARQGVGHLQGSRYVATLKANEQHQPNAKANSVLSEYGFGEIINIDANDTEALIDTYNQLKLAQEQMINTIDPATLAISQTYTNVTNWLEKMTPAVEEYKSAVESIKDYNIQLIANNINFEEAQSLDEYYAKIEEFRNKLQEANLDTDKSITEIVDSYLKAVDTDYSNLVLGIKELKKQVDDSGDAYIDKLTEGQKEYLLSGKVDLTFVQSAEDIEKELQKTIDNYGTFDVTTPISLETTLVSGNKLKKADNEALAALEDENSAAMAGFDNKSTLHQLETINEITDYRISKNQEYLKETEKVTQELIDLRNEEKDNWIENEEYKNLKAAEQRRDLKEEEKKQLDEYENRIHQLEDEIIELEHVKAEGLSFDEIEGIGFENLISGIEMVTNKAEALQNAAELIGEGFTVAASDVEKLSNIFPELLEGYETLADGSIKLNKDTVQETIEGIKTEMEARTEAKIAEVDQQIALKELEKKYLKEKLKNLKLYLDGKQSEQTTIDAINQAGFEYENGLMELTGQQIGDLHNFAIKETQEEGEALITMLNQVGKGFAKAANAHYAMLKGEKFTWGDDLTFSGYEGTAEDYASSVSDEAFARYTEAKERYEEIFEQAKEVENQLNTVDGELDELKKQKAVLESTGKAALHALDNVSKGKAGKDSKSGGKDKKDKDEKKLDEEFDRYWDIKKAIDAVERALSKLDKQQEKLYGYELIKSLKLENQLLDQQAANYKALAEAQREEAAELQNILAGYGVTFDASGAITNYAAATAAALQQYNQAIQMYNAGLLSESALGVYEKNYEAFKKALERYDTLYYTEMKETQEKLEEIRRKQLENNLKAWETEIQIKLDMKELERQWNDFMKEITEDFKKVYKDLRVDLKTMLKDAKTYIGKDGTLGTIIKAVQDVTKEIDKMRHGGSSDMFESISQAQEKLKELNDQLLDSAKALHDLWEEAWDNYLDGIDQVADKFDDLTDRFEKINDELEFQKELIELLYGEEAYGLMNKLYAGQQHNMEEQLKSLKQQKDMWEDLFYASGATLENQTEWTADQQKYYEEWMEAQGDLNDLVLEYIQLLKDDYLNTVKDVLKQFENMVTGGKGLSTIQEQWERISDRAEKYYDSVEGAYEIQKLANEIDKSIANTANLKNQQKLQALREREIGYLREKDNLTKYDLEAAEARYQIALKEMALEDARNNKNSMKLTRNAQGNWSYQYIADEEDVGDKQQDLLQAYSQLYQLASEAYEKNLESLIELEQTYQEKAFEINEKYINDEELKEQKLLELEAWYQEEKNLLTEENTLYRNDLEEGASALLLEIYRQDEEAYEAMNEKERTLLDSLVNAHISEFMDLQDKLSTNYDNIGIKAEEVMAFIRADWLSGAQEIADIWNSDDGASVKMQILATHEAISQATKRYQELVDVCANIIERDFSEQGIAGAIIRAEQETDSLSNKTVQLVNTSKPYLDDLRKYVDQIGAAWRAVQGDIKNAIKLIQEYLKYIGDVKAAVDSLNNGGGAYPGGVVPDGGDKGSGGGPGNGSSDYDAYDDPYGAADKYMVTNKKTGVQRIIHATTRDEAIKKAKSIGFASGGYTGSWNGSDGKFAMLHQKELVLNADDTKNFLSGINMIRDMSNVNGSIEKSILQSVANMVMSLGNIKAGSVNTNSNVTNNENGNVFNITAEFPNANDVNEIREAILTLPNLASQYVNKNAI